MPLTVYLLEEIWELVRTLPLDANVAIVDYTKKRLSHRSPVVKQKVRTSLTRLCTSADQKASPANPEMVSFYADFAPDQAHLQQGQL